jgi:hypothetical protein
MQVMFADRSVARLTGSDNVGQMMVRMTFHAVEAFSGLGDWLKKH